MIHYLILVKILDHDLFAQYIKGHIPTIVQFGGKIVFRSTENTAVFGSGDWDVVAMQEWPSSEHFDHWWVSDEYRPWAEIRDRAAVMEIVKCKNDLIPACNNER